MTSGRDQFAVLVVDDDELLLRLARTILEGEHCRVTVARTGTSAIEAFGQQPAALVLLDMGLPDIEGLEVCRQLRSLPGGDRAFILFLSGRRELADKVAGFLAGADDYVTKPLDTYELSLRVRAIRRRTAGPLINTADLSLGTWILQAGTRTLITADGAVTLTPVEFQLLHHLMRHPDTLHASETLLREVWHYPPGSGSTDLVRFHVRNLRKKLEPDPEHPRYLISAPHHGYMLRTP